MGEVKIADAERLAALEAEVSNLRFERTDALRREDALEAENARLKAPVSDEEISRFATFSEDGTMFNANVIVDMLAARAKEGK